MARAGSAPGRQRSAPAHTGGRCPPSVHLAPPWGPVPGGGRAQPSRPALQHSPGSSVAPTCTGTPLTSPRYSVPLLSGPPGLVDFYLSLATLRHAGVLALIRGAEFSCFSTKARSMPVKPLRRRFAKRWELCLQRSPKATGRGPPCINKPS